ncbi:hypothetical protein QQX98_012049 [Neonectria punicea]|uniref:Uncharacterized protein n=1 Tax=Neonectria punicea TaxID=979145 RepID=A0ABR1GKD2_9HYPO
MDGLLDDNDLGFSESDLQMSGAQSSDGHDNGDGGDGGDDADGSEDLIEGDRSGDGVQR